MPCLVIENIPGVGFTLVGGTRLTIIKQREIARISDCGVGRLPYSERIHEFSMGLMQCFLRDCLRRFHQ